MSTLTEEGVQEVKKRACQKLAAARLEVKLQSGKVGAIANRLHVAMPKKRDQKARPAHIPEAARAKVFWGLGSGSGVS